MKYYLRFMIVAVVCGILCVVGFSVTGKEFTASGVIGAFGMSEIDYYLACLSSTTQWIIPLILFQVFFGTYIYRHFCTASVYYFSRNTNRIKWLSYEMIKLYVFCILYLAIMVITGLVVCGLLANLKLDNEMWMKFLLYITLYSLYLFATTLAINLISVISNSSVGFIVVESFNVFCIVAFTIVGDYFAPNGYLEPRYEWMIKVNPFSYLVFSTKGVMTDYMTSIIMYAIASIIFIIAGCIIVNKYSFVENYRE